MMRVGAISLAVLLGVIGWTTSVPAQVPVPAPRPGVVVGAPPAPGGVVVQEPMPVLPPPTPLAAPVVLRPMTHQQFAACFTPVPGCHEALLIHPGSGCPVLVRFTLPPGCPKVRVERRELEFDYGRCEVEIRFKLFGKVAVNYN